MDRRIVLKMGAAGLGMPPPPAPPRPSFRPTTGTATTGVPRRRSRPARPGSVSAISARGSAPRVRGRDGHDTLPRCRARLRDGPRHLCHGRLRRQHLPGCGHGEGDRGLRAGADGPETLLRPTWRELQKRPGRLDPDPYWKTTLAVAKQYGKRVGFRVQMSDPDIDEPALPDFVLDKVPMVRLRGGEWKRGPVQKVPGAALRPSVLPGRLPRAERTPGRRARRQPARRVHGHFHVRLLG